MADFPPTCWQDIAAYDSDECMAGYMEYSADDPDPGPNRSPAYRWGWSNRKADMAKKPEGDPFHRLRREYAREGLGIGKTRH